MKPSRTTAHLVRHPPSLFGPSRLQGFKSDSSRGRAEESALTLRLHRTVWNVSLSARRC